MNYLRYIRRAGIALLLLSVVGLTGCTDSMLTEPPQEEVTPATYSPSSTSSEQMLERDSTGTMLIPHRVIERY